MTHKKAKELTISFNKNIMEAIKTLPPTFSFDGLVRGAYRVSTQAVYTIDKEVKYSSEEAERATQLVLASIDNPLSMSFCPFVGRHFQYKANYTLMIEGYTPGHPHCDGGVCLDNSVRLDTQGRLPTVDDIRNYIMSAFAAMSVINPFYISGVRYCSSCNMMTLEYKCGSCGGYVENHFDDDDYDGDDDWEEEEDEDD